MVIDVADYLVAAQRANRCAKSKIVFCHKNQTSRFDNYLTFFASKQTTTMSDDEEIAALVIDNGSGMCKGKL